MHAQPTPADVLAFARTSVASLPSERSVAVQRYNALIEATALKLGLRQDLDGTGFDGFDLSGRLQLALQIADSVAPPAESVRQFVREASLEALEAGHTIVPVVGLALWAGCDAEEARLGALSTPERGLALHRALSAGVPRNHHDAVSFIDATLADRPSREAAYLVLFQSRFDPEAPGIDDWLGLADAITVGFARGRLLLELTAQVSQEDLPSLAPAMAGAAARLAGSDADMQTWPGQLSAMAGGVAAHSDAAIAAAHVEDAWTALPAIPSAAADVLADAWRTLMLAESQRGVEAWRGALARLTDARTALRVAGLFEELVFHAAGLCRLVRGGTDARSSALTSVSELIGRITSPMMQALAWGAFAEAARAVEGRSAATAISQLELAMGREKDARQRMQALPQVIRLAAQADAGSTLSLLARLESPDEQVLGALATAEAAAGIRR